MKRVKRLEQLDKIASARTKINQVRANPPKWSLRSPKAYDEYLNAQELLINAFEEGDLGKATTALARAWVAGQDSEKKAI